MVDHVKKVIKFQLENPYDSPAWPEISPNDQDTILELLCSLLAPIGAHRQNHIIPSKGKRSSKKRKREDGPKPAMPEIASHILVGFNSITRHLQSLSQESKTSLMGNGNGNEEAKQIAAIFTTNPSPTHSILHSHFPLLVSTATLSRPDGEATRLVQLPKGCDGRLASALNLARVNFVAVLEEAEGAEILLGLVREKVGVCEELNGVAKAEYLDVKIAGVETSVGVSRKERRELDKRKSGDIK